MTACREIDVQSLQRSINFYDLTLGFEVVHLVSRRHERRATMSLANEHRLELRERGIAPGATSAEECWMLAVLDLDRVREVVWELGVTVSRDSGAVDRIFCRGDRRSFYIRDPDGHEIELVELRPGTARRRAAYRERTAPSPEPGSMTRGSFSNS